MEPETSYDIFKTLFGHQATRRELESLELETSKVREDKNKERTRANEAAKWLRKAFHLPPLGTKPDKIHEIKFKQYKLNAQSSHIDRREYVDPSKVSQYNMSATERVSSMTIMTHHVAPVKVDRTDAELLEWRRRNEGKTMDQARTRIEKSAVNQARTPKAGNQAPPSPKNSYQVPPSPKGSSVPPSPKASQVPPSPKHAVIAASPKHGQLPPLAER